MIVIDTDRLESDGAYREEMRHRCETDHLFLAQVMGFDAFDPDFSTAVSKLYFPKNRNLSIPEQNSKKFRMHLDPRGTGKTTFGLVDTMQWILAFPDTISIMNETATQDLAKSVTNAVGMRFYKRKDAAATPLQLLYPELCQDKFYSGSYIAPTRKQFIIEPTLGYTSPQTSQSGWHPWIINPDDMVDSVNSGVQASDTSRKGIIAVYHANKNTLRFGGYINVRGTRYHPFDLYGDLLDHMDPEEWEILIRSSMRRLDNRRLTPGEFPARDEVELYFPKLLGYYKLKSLFEENYESFMCFCAGSRMLMADGTEKPIEQMQVGDEVIGFEKVGNRDTRLVKTKVVRTFSRQADTVETKTDCGRKVRHTPDHRFLRPPDGRNLRYVKLRLKSKLVSVYRPSEKPTEDQQRDWDWLGGLLDGEGSISKTGITISQQEAANPEVFAKIKTYSAV